MRIHDLFMGDGHPDDQSRWVTNLTTDQCVDRVSEQIRSGEIDGDEVTITIRTREPKVHIAVEYEDGSVARWAIPADSEHVKIVEGAVENLLGQPNTIKL